MGNRPAPPKLAPNRFPVNPEKPKLKSRIVMAVIVLTTTLFALMYLSAVLAIHIH